MTDFWSAVVSTDHDRVIIQSQDLCWIIVSDHPLTHMLRETTTKPTIGIFEAAITQALLLGKRFGIVTTGSGYSADIHKGVQAIMGGDSQRFAGIVTTGLGVVELREGDRQKIERNMKEYSGKIAQKGADVILLGCAGM